MYSSFLTNLKIIHSLIHSRISSLPRGRGNNRRIEFTEERTHSRVQEAECIKNQYVIDRSERSSLGESELARLLSRSRAR